MGHTSSLLSGQTAGRAGHPTTARGPGTIQSYQPRRQRGHRLWGTATPKCANLLSVEAGTRKRGKRPSSPACQDRGAMGWAAGLLTTVLSSLLGDTFSVRALTAKLQSELLWCGALICHADGLALQWEHTHS